MKNTDFDFQNGFRALRSLQLTEEERTADRARLAEFMALNTLVAEEKGSTGLWTWFYSLTQRPMFVSSLVITLAVFLTGGVSYAAESSLPGDFLYPVKVEVNEEIRSALQISAESKAIWELERADRRLEEAALLSAQGELTAEASQDLEVQLNEHKENLSEILIDLEGEGSDEWAHFVETNWNGMVESHDELLIEDESEVKGEVETDLKLDVSTDASVDASVDAEVQGEGFVEVGVPLTEEEKKEEEQNEDTVEGDVQVETQVEVEAEAEASASSPVDVKDEDIKVDLPVDVLPQDTEEELEDVEELLPIGL